MQNYKKQIGLFIVICCFLFLFIGIDFILAEGPQVPCMCQLKYSGKKCNDIECGKYTIYPEEQIEEHALCAESSQDCEDKCWQHFGGKFASFTEWPSPDVKVDYSDMSKSKCDGTEENMCYAANIGDASGADCMSKEEIDEFEDKLEGSAEYPEYAPPPEVDLEVPFGTTGHVKDIGEYITVLYQYLVILIAFAAVVMMIFGGFKWATSAGNSSQIASARTTITNSIIGLVLALTSYLLLYTINPALVNMGGLGIPFVPPIPSESEGFGGSCTTMESGGCATSLIEKGCSKFTPVEKWSAVCNAESGGQAGIASSTDICNNKGNPISFSIGIWQINMIVHGSKIPGDCTGLWDSDKGLNSKGSCLPGGERTTAGVNWCQDNNCWLTDKGKQKYQACKSALSDPKTNTEIACSLGGWSNWKTSWTKCFGGGP